MSTLLVREPGLHTTVQDFGRVGMQRFGLPSAGALDRVSLTLANALVGNPPGAAALEVLLGGLVLEVEAESVRIALAGVEASLTIGNGEAEPRHLPAWRSVRLWRGQSLKVPPLSRTSCAYVAVEGGFDLPPVLGSLATYTRAGVGGLEGRALRAGDRLPLRRAAASDGGEAAVPRPPDAGDDKPVRVVLGPQDDYFTEAALESFLASRYRVSTSADRMGFRLDGPKLEHRDGFDLISDGIAPGSVQVPGSGQPILLLADRQTTGGYPKIATVISADLPAIGRRRPGDEVRFEAVTLAAAIEARRQQERWLEMQIKGLVPLDETGSARLDLLYSENLISGVVAGGE